MRTTLSIRARWATVAFVIALGGGVLAACGSSVDSPRVLVVGDSILNQSSDKVQAVLAQHGWQPTIAAFGGTAIEQWTAALPRLVAEHKPSIVVVELGTNDCTQGGECPQVSAAIDSTLSALKPAQQILWLNVQTQPTYPGPSGAKQVDVALNAAAQQHANLRIVDLSDKFANHPEWLDNGGPHLTPAGQLVFASLIENAVDQFHVNGS
jgi:lysophospholipase L1-like esterase